MDYKVRQILDEVYSLYLEEAKIASDTEIPEITAELAAARAWAFNKVLEIIYPISQETKNAWSEEDEIMIEDIIEAIDTQYAVSDYNDMVSWLKSLKERMKGE